MRIRGERAVSGDLSPSPASSNGSRPRTYLPFVNNFCPRRSVETSRYGNYFLANGWRPTRRLEKADLIFIYTCGCFNSSEKRTLNTIRQALARKKPGAEVVVTGCLLKIHPEVLGGDYRLLPLEEINALDGIIDARVRLGSVPEANRIHPIRDLISTRDFLVKKFKMDFELTSLFASKVRSLFLGRTKYRGTWNIRIATGCLGNCSYCAVKFAGGRVKSKAPEAVVEEFSRGLRLGEKTFVLINNDTGSYGQDIGTDIVSLMERLLDFEGDYKIRLIDLNPRWLVRYFDRWRPLLRKHASKIAYMSMPVQSGSERILKLMRRPYTARDIRECFHALKKDSPGLVINTHFIVGFPGETDRDFADSLALAREFDFGRLSIHPYHDRPRTESSTMPDKVPGPVMFRRYRALLSI